LKKEPQEITPEVKKEPLLELPKIEKIVEKPVESENNLIVENFLPMESDNVTITLSNQLQESLLSIGKVRRIETRLKSFWNRTKVFRRKYEMWILLKTGAFYDTLFKRPISPLKEFCVFSGFKIHYDIRVPTLIQKDKYIYCYDLKDGRILSFNENISQVINPKALYNVTTREFLKNLLGEFEEPKTMKIGLIQLIIFALGLAIGYIISTVT